MNKQKIIQWLPSFLILIGVGFWGNTLYFSPITNQHEAKLVSYFQDNFERSYALMDSINLDVQRSVKTAILKIPSSQPIFNTGNEIGKFQEIAIKRLNEKLAQSDTSIYQIISDFDTNTSRLLWKISENNPLISSEEITNLFHETGFSNAKPFNNVDYIIAFQKNQIIQNTTKYLDFLSRNVGYRCGPFDDFRSTIKFNETLKTGNASNGQIFLMAHYDRMLNETWRINDQPLPSRDGVAKRTEQFTNNFPKVLSIECEYYKERLCQYEIVIDTFIKKEQFIIHPIKK